MKLSEAIRLGATMSPQARGRFYDPSTQGTCALGAAALATGILFTWDGSFMQAMAQRFPLLHDMGVVRWIQNSNDSGMSRERIARQVEEWEAEMEVRAARVVREDGVVEVVGVSV